MERIDGLLVLTFFPKYHYSYWAFCFAEFSANAEENECLRRMLYTGPDPVPANIQVFTSGTCGFKGEHQAQYLSRNFERMPPGPILFRDDSCGANNSVKLNLLTAMNLRILISVLFKSAVHRTLSVLHTSQAQCKVQIIAFFMNSKITKNTVLMSR